MLSQYPRPHRIFVRTSLASAWLFAAGAGITATALSTAAASVVRELGFVMTIVCGLALCLGSLIACFGVVFKRYRYEWAASWFAAFGISPYIISLWGVIIQGEITRLTQAELVTSLLLFFVSRAAICGAHAARLRAMHVDGEVVTNAIDIVDNSTKYSADGE